MPWLRSQHLDMKEQSEMDKSDVAQIQNLSRLVDQGVITWGEFTTMKRKIIYGETITTFAKTCSDVESVSDISMPPPVLPAQDLLPVDEIRAGLRKIIGE